MYFETRKREVAFLKSLWREEPPDCPKCGGTRLVILHKKAKKCSCDWKCPACGEIYRTIQMLKALPD